MNSPRFSVTAIARNEAKTLPRMVASLKEFQARGGEIVLVDTGSTDGTAELARSLGCKVFEEGTRFMRVIDDALAGKINDRFTLRSEKQIVKAGDKCFDYAAARGHAVSVAANEFVVTIDCDEAFTNLNIDALNAAIEKGIQQVSHQYVFSHDAEGRPLLKFLREAMFDRRALKWANIIHEVPVGMGRKQEFSEADILLEHYQQSSPHRANYLIGLALDCYLNPDSDRNAHYFGRELLWMGFHNSAIAQLERHAAMPHAWNTERAQSILYVGDARMKLGNEEAAIAAYHRAIAIDCGIRGPWMRLAEHYWNKADHQRAACYASGALQIKFQTFYMNEMSHYRQLPHEIMYWALWYLGDKEGAKREWAKALAFDPENPKLKSEARFFAA